VNIGFLEKSTMPFAGYKLLAQFGKPPKTMAKGKSLSSTIEPVATSVIFTKQFVEGVLGTNHK